MSSSDAAGRARTGPDLGKRRDAGRNRTAANAAGPGTAERVAATGRQAAGQAQPRVEPAHRESVRTEPTRTEPSLADSGRHDTATGASHGTGGRADHDVRKARLVLARVDPWSVMKLGFLLSIALAIVGLVAVFVLWTVLENMGVWDSLSQTLGEVTKSETNSGFKLMDYAGLSKVMGVSTVLACVNVVLMTALATLGAFLYNLASSLVGGLHVTLSEDA